MSIQELVMQRRAEQGLKLSFWINEENREFNCYPKDEEQKQMWISRAALKGWVKL